MTEKKKYLELLKINQGFLDELELGLQLGMDEATTQKIISLLLSEYKIEYKPTGACNYRAIQKK